MDDDKVKVYHKYCFMSFDEPVHVENVDGTWRFFDRKTQDRQLSGKYLSDTRPSWAWTTDNPYDLVYLDATKRDTDVLGLSTLELPAGCNLYNVRPTVIVTKTRPGSDWVQSKQYVEANMPLPLPEGALTNTVDWLETGPYTVGTRTVYTCYPKPSTNYHDNYYGTHLQIGYTYYEVVDGSVRVYKCIWKCLVGEDKVALLIELNEQEVGLELLQGYSGDSKDSRW
jgi:hypothetical protein